MRPTAISKLSVLHLVFFFICIPMQSGHAQSRPDVDAQFNQLAQAYRSGELSEIRYLEQVDSLATHLLSQGVSFDVQELAAHLALYEEIAWSSKKYERHRTDYYVMLLNNAHMFDLRGASMYYAEKVSQESKKRGQERQLIELATKTYIYSIQKNYQKIIDAYQRQAHHVAAIRDSLKSDTSFAYLRALDALHLMSGVITAYSSMRDTLGVEQTTALAQDIVDAIRLRYPIRAQNMLLNDFHALTFDFAKASFYQDYQKAESILRKIENLKSLYKDEPTGFIDLNLLEWRTSLYLEIGNIDSAAYYVQKYKEIPQFSESQQTVIKKYSGQLEALKGNYATAYALLSEALDEDAKAQASLVEEIDNLLYAYTESEHNRIALQKAEKAKQQRLLWIVAITFLAVIAIVAIYLFMRNKERKAKIRIETLNNMANMQIASMEEITAQAVRQEQQRLARDLHDNLSSSLAGIKHQLELLTIDNPDNPLAPKLAEIGGYMDNAYAISRGKSHQWFQHAESLQETSFQNRIQTLLDTALPDSRYTKTIEIDEQALDGVVVETRIELLRIIQEAVTNIIKHAKANAMSILLYQEVDQLVLSISDNGKGMSTRNASKKGIGLQLIQERIQGLGGTLSIDSTANGTEIAVNIPFHAA